MRYNTFLFYAFALIVFAGLASASVDFVGVSGNNQSVIPGSSVTLSFNVQGTGFTGSFDNSHLILPSIGSATWSGDIGNFSLLPNTNVSRTVLLHVPVTQNSGIYTGYINFTGVYNESNIPNTNLLQFFVNVNRFCELGSSGYLEISDFDITNNGEGEDDVWNPLDSIEIDVEVENTDDSSITDVNVEILILDENGKDVTDDFDFDDDTIDLGKIKGDDQEVATFILLDVPSDVEEGDYKMFIKAYKDGDEDTQCIDHSSDLSDNYYHSFSIEKEYDSGVLVKKSDLGSIEASCGSDVELMFDVYNVGEDKEESVLVLIENRDLGLSQFVVLSDLRADEKEQLTFIVSLPQGLTKTSYKIDISTFFDYDEDSDVEDVDSYDQSSFDDLDEDYTITLRVSNCQSNNAGLAGISASLKSDAKIGSEMVVETMITNTANTAKDFIITSNDYSSWADLVSIEPQAVSIPAGSTQTVLIKLKPTDSGTHTFNIQALSGASISTQAVQVTVAEKTGLFTGAFSGVSNTVMYSILILVIVLILILLIVIIRVSFRSPRKNSEF